MTGTDREVAAGEVAAYTVPTDAPEADGTLAWDSTTVVVVKLTLADGGTGLGFTYGHHCLAHLVRDSLLDIVIGRDVRDSTAAWEAMVRAIRNQGRPGLASMAIAAVDIAIWDAKARCLGQPLHRLLGPVRDEVPVYGSGGFTTYDTERLLAQLAGWVADGIPRVKLKIGADWGRDWQADVERVREVRAAVGPETELYVDANGAYDRSRARSIGWLLADEADVEWFEEPVTSDDVGGLARLAADLPMDVTAGEYGYDLPYFTRLLPAVDVAQIDVTRCAGITEWLRITAAAETAHVPTSAHCAPALHAPLAAATRGLRHIEYFHDHARIERMLFDGAQSPVNGALRPDESDGLGLALKDIEAERYRVA